MASMLAAPFNGEEVREALKQMHPTKAPGKDKFRILSQFVKPTPNTFYSLCPAQAIAYSDLLSNTVIGLDFPDPFSSGLPFRPFKKQKSDVCCRTCYHSNHFRKPRPTPLPVG